MVYVYSKLFLLGVWLLVIGIDTVGYFVGKQFGQHKIVPTISPKKSVEGYVGAMLWVVFVESITLIVNDIPILPLTLYFIIVYILATTGDLLVSYQKRTLNIKDSGTLIPGHGGVLDRFDSWLFVVPFVYLIV